MKNPSQQKEWDEFDEKFLTRDGDYRPGYSVKKFISQHFIPKSEVDNIKKGENWRLGYQAGVDEMKAKIERVCEEMKRKLENKDQAFMREDSAYNQALTDLKNNLLQ